MTYDLRRESWIPWRRCSGRVEWGPPASLVDRLEEDPIVALATPRPDFDGAMQEFLIGLLTVALQPSDEEAWLALWRRPPGKEELQAALDALPTAFDLDGDGPRFFQDHSAEDLSETAPVPVERLLIDAPGEQGIRLNKDLFVKRDRVEQLGRPAAAMALLTLQTYAPAGGQGQRTSLRGGGPLTTLVDPRVDAEGELRAHEQPLWAKLWANVQTTDQWGRHASAAAKPSDVFPWLAPTRISDKNGCPTTPGDAHPLQAFFGLPRRIRLEFGDRGRCDLTGKDDERTVASFRMRNYGVKYVGWRHPLSPYYFAKASNEWLPVHGQPGGVGWRDWIGISMQAPEAGHREPAAVVAAFSGRGRRLGITVLRLDVFGYDMENMKARGWAEAMLPAFATPHPEQQRLLADTAARLTSAAGIAARATLSAVKEALFDRPKDAPGDMSEAKTRLWAATEAPFFDHIRRVAAPEATTTTADRECRAFASTVERCAAMVFDRWCPYQGIAPDAMRRLVVARYRLVTTLRGHSRLGKELFEALRIVTPGTGDPKTARERTRKENTA